MFVIRATTRPVEQSDVDFLCEKLNGLGRFSGLKIQS